MEVTVRYNGPLADITKPRPEFLALQGLDISETEQRRWFRGSGIGVSHDIQAAFIGKTGYGKSSTINALLGKRVMETSDTRSCTRAVQSLEFKIRNGNYFSFADLPGIGENQEIDEEYRDLYSQIAQKSDVIVYLLRCDTRDYSIDLDTINGILSTREIQKKTIFAVNCCDKVEPISRSAPFSPTRQQEINIHRKISSIGEIFGNTRPIVPYSATEGWNLGGLASQMVNVIRSSVHEFR